MAEYTNAPESEFTPIPVDIPKEHRTDLGVGAYSRVLQALGDRSGFDADLDYWNDLYEMRVGEKSFPWPDSANVFIPLIPTQLDTLAARLTATVFPPRLFLVNGNTDEAAKSDHEVERYYNAELARHNWTEAFYQWMHLALRDGTSLLKIIWRREKRKRKVVRATEEIDEQTGQPVPDPKDPTKPKMTTEVITIEETVYDDVELIPVEVRDFLILPSYATDINKSSVAHKLKLDEFDLIAMTKGEGAVLWRDAVDEILPTLDDGEDQMPLDIQGTSTYENNGEITISGTDGSSPGTIRQKKGPWIIWEIYSDSYSIDKKLGSNGEPEDWVLYVDSQTQTLLGCVAYKYWHGRKPFVPLAPMPRLNRFYGFSVVERLRYLQEELNALHNQRLDNIDRALGAPMYKTEGANVKTKDMSWKPNSMFEVGSKEDIGFLQAPPVPIEAQTEENALQSYAQSLTGLSAPMTGGTNTGRRTAKEVQQASASAGVRLDLMAARIREGMKEAFFQIHHLKLQYGPNEMSTSVATPNGTPEKLQISKVKLAQDYDLSIAGMGGPIDKQGRQQSMLFLYSLLMKNPLIMQDPIKIFAVTRMLLEEYDRVDIPTLLGTQEELMQKMQAQAQAAQAQAAQQAAMGQHSQGQQTGQHTPQAGAQQSQQKPQAPAMNLNGAGSTGGTKL